jgi:hypothetical protein
MVSLQDRMEGSSRGDRQKSKPEKAKRERERAYREAGAQEAFAFFDIGQPSGRVITAVVVLHSRRDSWVQPRPMRG